jgi:hypothetical protein
LEWDAAGFGFLAAFAEAAAIAGLADFCNLFDTTAQSSAVSSDWRFIRLKSC